MYALWPLAENLGAISLEQYEVLPGTARVGPCTCVVLQKRVPATVENQIFVDLEREFTVVRVVGMENGTIARQVDIQYERQPRNDVWFPTGWKFSILRRDSQGFSFLSESSVDMVNLGYQSTDEDFILKYPRGTRIYDLRSEQTYFVGHSGTPRLLDETEQHLTAEQILAGKSSRSWILAANGAALLVLSVVIVALRRLRANRH